MPKKTLILVAAVLACGLILAGSVLAANGFAIPRSVIGGGGQLAVGGDYILHGTVGEPIASGFDQGATYGVSSGFWWPTRYKVYLPLVLKN
ncbi:MAG: hypothetical protein JXR84_25100 [Anaerolineae bacterium]|nr:hypothetical protein [Anaerolineae bacterium]